MANPRQLKQPTAGADPGPAVPPRIRRGTLRHPSGSSRRITPKDADYVKHMVQPIDHQFHIVDYDVFMREFVLGDDMPDGKLETASTALTNGLALRFARDGITEFRLYPVLVS